MCSIAYEVVIFVWRWTPPTATDAHHCIMDYKLTYLMVHRTCEAQGCIQDLGEGGQIGIKGGGLCLVSTWSPAISPMVFFSENR